MLVKHTFLNRLTWGLIIVIAAAVGLGVSELTLRYLFPELRFMPYPLNRVDDRVVYITKSNLKGTYPWFAIQYHLTTNSRGLREKEEIPYNPATDEVRVLFLGDSFTFGLGVNDGEDVVRASESIVRGVLGNSIRFINMAVAGSGPSVQYLHFMEEGRRYKPRIVVVQVCDNDLYDDERDNVFRLQNGKLVRNPSPVAKSHRSKLFPLYQWLVLNSVVFNTARRSLRKVTGIQAMQGEKETGEKKTKVSSRSERVSKVVWGKLIDAIREEKATPVFMFADNHRDALIEWRTQTFNAAREVCRQKQVQIINPKKAVEKQFAEDLFRAYLSKRDQHWSREGNRVVGQHLADSLLPLLNKELENDREFPTQ